MEQHKQHIADLVKTARLAKGYTQLDLAEKSNISLRSIQRIENAEVNARVYTLRILAQVLEFPVPVEVLVGLTREKAHSKQHGKSSHSFLIAVVIGICFILFASAFLSQSSVFPETTFELLLFWALVTSLYLLILTRLFKLS